MEAESDRRVLGIVMNAMISTEAYMQVNAHYHPVKSYRVLLYTQRLRLESDIIGRFPELGVLFGHPYNND